MIIYRDNMFIASAGRGSYRTSKEFYCTNGHQRAAMDATAWESRAKEKLERKKRERDRDAQRVVPSAPYVATICGKEYAIAEYMSTTGRKRRCKIEGSDLAAAGRMASRMAGRK